MRMQRAEQVKFVADENGWEMHVTDDEGFTERYNVQAVAIDLLKNLNDTIGEWYREGLAAAEPSAYDRMWGPHEADYDLARDLERGK